MGILWTLIIGAIAGWLGSLIFRGYGLGLLGNIIVGIIGGFIGYWLLGSLFGTAIIGQILTGAVGAIILLAIINLVSGRRLD
ncbi:GlsB/YeaQ/YmgE family stress response membrane protein [Chryseobacterium lacus]|uniref:GlsB/YeaQ/YmgE family stress response membrane protein n=1 Tax=Chryseobacterium lacus TaxID=2058346 RepID=A0A368N0A7_9FLAO|nr:GlsB/YeaQ/YmgE family stress response membrane protein [Chryseobacterium lacus]RCU43918.1 GlsB/YeaQ/YmgE family stress response membrane protein [Chryseobacterium lacus]RST25923.1 GlsB/YeaQ/YmgE family stress response membrane protein [Chryseobacterium lacus]RST28846.1 GlsB/YeaQ/YmgE family stress response membrane protein [Chryseobacterium lacus]